MKALSAEYQPSAARRLAVVVQRSVIRRQMLSELSARVKWLNEQDPHGEHPKMQGAKYAYLTCAKWLRKNL